MSNDDERPKRIWGLDLAGLGGKDNTGLAMSELANNSDSVTEVTVFKNHPFSSAHDRRTRWDHRGIEEMVDCLQKWTAPENHLYVDIPIDLQGLPYISDPLFVFQTKLRVADFVLGGLPPFASWIGSQTTDFRSLATKADILDRTTGATLFEAYPKVTIDSLFDTTPKFKGSNASKAGPKYKGSNATEDGMIKVQKALNINDSTIKLNDDDIDAIVCVLSGVHSSHSLTSSVLADRWNELSRTPMTSGAIESEHPRFFEPPKGYRVLPNVEKWQQQSVSIKVQDWPTWRTI